MFKWTPPSKKQLAVLTWWQAFPQLNGIICEGSIRTGKTLTLSFSFICWSMSNYDKQQFALCGKTIGSLRRNLITPLKEVLINRGFKVLERVTDNKLIISFQGKTNTYFLFGGRDERSQDLVQGVTLAGVLFDEVALMPRSFVDQAIGRCSVEGSKFWFNCNPEGPQHWFYTEHVLKAEEKHYLRLHFILDDNPSLSPEIIQRYKNMFSGIFYKRFILGEWAFADGVVYDCYSQDKNGYTDEERDTVLPIYIRENDTANGGAAIYGSDYGVNNPMVFLRGYKLRLPGDPVPHFYIDDEYYYDSKKHMAQKTDEEYVNDFLAFNGDLYFREIVIDPSASSLIASFRKRGVPVRKANNDVEEGIRMVYSLMATGHIHINISRCPNLVSELGLYIWDQNKADRGQEKVVKAHDHALDALRYLIKTTTANYEVF